MILHRLLSAAFLAMLSFAACESRKDKAVMPEPEPPANNGLYLSTATESAARSGLLPTVPSEDVSSLLGRISLPPQEPAEVTDYLPNSTVAWIVHAALKEPLKAKEVAKRFGAKGRPEFDGLTIYGLDTSTGHWTFLVSADGPEEVSELQFAWAYFASWSEDSKTASPEMFRARLESVERELNELTPTKLKANVDSKDAHERAKHLRALNERLDRSVSIRLAAPAGKSFSGTEIWDVMLCLGLRWGDMDCLHWRNPSASGDENYFSVWTSTRPGYFLPEEAAAGRVNVEDLVFGYSIPRSADPVTVYRRMSKAVEYAQKRLGGSITSEDGRRLDTEAALTEIQRISDELKKEGFLPGSDNALQQF